MGANPLGSNRKLRTSLIYTSPHDLQVFKGLSSDIAETRGRSVSQTVIDLLLHDVASTARGREYAFRLYSSENPGCLQLYEDFFAEISMLGECGGDSTPVLRGFIRYCLDFSLGLDLGNERAYHLREQWDSVSRGLEMRASAGDPGAGDLADRATELADELKEPEGSRGEPAVEYVKLIADGWQCLRGRSSTFSALTDISCIGKPDGSKGANRETALTRLDLVRKIDTFFMGCREADRS